MNSTFALCVLFHQFLLKSNHSSCYSCHQDRSGKSCIILSFGKFFIESSWAGHRRYTVPGMVGMTDIDKQLQFKMIMAVIVLETVLTPAGRKELYLWG